MSRFEPFPGLRYDDEIVSLSEAIAPPYDVVSDSDRAVLVARSPYNAINVELPIPNGDVDRYTNAAAIFSRWQSEGAVRRDDAPSYYIYRMNFVTELGQARSTIGVLGALGLDRPGGSQVLPHERTMPKPKGDRLDLLRACQANLSPIWGLSLAEGLADLCNSAASSQPAPMSATDEEGIVHELWPISDPTLVTAISDLVSSTPIVIADGHHRYETAIFYQEERREDLGNEEPGDFDLVMALIVELSADELFVQPIHRLITGLPEDFDLPEALSEHFTVTAGPSEVDELARQLHDLGALALITPSGNYYLVPSAALHDAAEADLDSSRLDVALESLPAHDLSYQHGVRLVAQAVGDKAAQYGVLLRPASVEQIADTAHSGRRMPPKTTFFQPKPRTGMVYRQVKD